MTKSTVLFFNMTFTIVTSGQYGLNKGSVYLDVLVEDVLANFGINSREGVVKKVNISVCIQCPREVHLEANIVVKNFNEVTF